MSRCAVLPMPGDPFLLNAFLANFHAIWESEVDRLYICLNIDPRMPPEIKEYDIARLYDEPKVTLVTRDVMLMQGAALRELLNVVQEDLIMSIEDDTVIVKRGEIDRCFRKIETGEADVVGSPRFSCSTEILDASAKKYKLDYSGYGDKGPNLWPNFFFCRKSDLMRTNLHFEPMHWEPGTYIPELDIIAKEKQEGDVFVWLSMQLRALGLKFLEVPQYHSHPEDLLFAAQGTGIFDVKCPWIHIGSFTMTCEDLLMGVHDPEGYVGKPQSLMEKQEFERRYAWMQVFLSEKDNMDPKLYSLKEVYLTRINKFIRAFELSPNRIHKLFKLYRGFISW